MTVGATVSEVIKGREVAINPQNELECRIIGKRRQQMEHSQKQM